MKRTDTELLDALEATMHTGACPGLVNDDNGHWAVSGSGMQSVPMGDEPIDVIQTTFYIEAAQWEPSIREAIEKYLAANLGAPT